MKDTNDKNVVKRIASLGFEPLRDLHALHGACLCLVLLAMDAAHLSALSG